MPLRFQHLLATALLWLHVQFQLAVVNSLGNFRLKTGQVSRGTGVRLEAWFEYAPLATKALLIICGAVFCIALVPAVTVRKREQLLNICQLTLALLWLICFGFLSAPLILGL